MSPPPSPLMQVSASPDVFERADASGSPHRKNFPPLREVVPEDNAIVQGYQDLFAGIRSAQREAARRRGRTGSALHSQATTRPSSSGPSSTGGYSARAA